MTLSTPPLPFVSVEHPLRPRVNVSNGTLPFPTGAWWTNWILANGESVIYCMPYALKILQNELHISYPFRVITPKVLQNGFLTHVRIAFPKTTRYEIIASDAFSVTVRFYNKSRGHCTAFLVRGSPYITVQYHNSAPVLHSGESIQWIRLKKNENNDNENLDSYRFLTNTNQMWQLFVSNLSSEMRLQSNTITSQSPLNGLLRLAITLDPLNQPILQHCAPVYPVGGSIKYIRDKDREDSLGVQYHWTVKTFGSDDTSIPLLMLTLPHHRDIIHFRKVGDILKRRNATNENVLVEELTFVSMRGVMKGVLGNVWYMNEKLPNVRWDYEDKGLLSSDISINGELLDSIQSTLGMDTVKGNSSDPAARIQSFVRNELTNLLEKEYKSNMNFAQDSYTFGKQIGRDARLLLIAKQLHHDEASQVLLTRLKTALEPWLNGSNADHLVYDKTYGGIITSMGWADQHADYGNGYYSDHHFHFGYFVYALAVVRKFDPSFIDLHGAACLALLGDIGTPLDVDTSASIASSLSNQTELWDLEKYFPVARHKDWYTGHSYASGLFPMENGKSQESSTESINAYYALALFTSFEHENVSVSIDGASYHQYARLLLAMELRSVKKYWHIDLNSLIYEPPFGDNAMVGVLGEMSAVYGTWFGNTGVYVHGINMIPFTPITSELFSQAYVSHEFTQIQSEYNSLPNSDIWKSALCMNHAIIHAEAAWKEFKSSVAAFDTWNSATNTLFWIATRPSWFDKKQLPHSNSTHLQCFGFPECNGLECCTTLPGCCPSALACCPVQTQIISRTAIFGDKQQRDIGLEVCYGEAQCAALNLSCCDSFEGCCEPQGENATLLGCCRQDVVMSPSVHDDNLQHPASSSGLYLIQGASLVALSGILTFAFALWYRRRHYTPIQRDMRMYYCMGTLIFLIVLVVFVSVERFL
uniref:glucan endo-1,3-beta-D-glucosidase n=1 Tax=Albugo laibachii Nc14 TaxID=890382 RepID=F0WCF9_9STRA|nr:hypothetical protein sce7103 [Albugo laibachii Nc14]|eukprot:CCA18874.1 hypothetical protein sce7103 [Albugo laibachii Nc14]